MPFARPFRDRSRQNFVGPELTCRANSVLVDLAWGLASRGIAVYRYDKRSFTAVIQPEEQTLDTLVVNDAVAAARRVAEVDGIAEDQVFVVGHRTGGRLCPRIADRHGGLAGIGLLDAPTFSFAESATDLEELARTAGWVTDREREAYRRQAEALRNLATSDPESIDDAETLAGQPGAWWKSWMRYDDLLTAGDLSVPGFVATTGQGFVGTREDHDRWWDALSGEGSRAEFYGDLNRYLQQGIEPSVTTEYLAFHDSVAGQVVADLAAWIEGVSET